MHASDTVRNAMLDAVETAIGTSAVMKIFDDGASGASIPANCAASNVGTVLATLSLPSDWLAAASSAAKAKSGTWEDASADASGTANYWRIYASNGTTCHLQGTAGMSGQELVLVNSNIAAGQPITISSFSLAAGNA